MIPIDVICLQNGIPTVNDYQWDEVDRFRYFKDGIKDHPEWNSNRARGLIALIALIKENPNEFSEFRVICNEELKRDVLELIEKRDNIVYGFCVEYDTDRDWLELEDIK